jgi:hypothetical protein
MYPKNVEVVEVQLSAASEVQLMWKCVEIVLHFLRYIFKNLASST